MLYERITKIPRGYTYIYDYYRYLVITNFVNKTDIIAKKIQELIETFEGKDVDYREIKESMEKVENLHIEDDVLVEFVNKGKLSDVYLNTKDYIVLR